MKMAQNKSNNTPMIRRKELNTTVRRFKGTKIVQEIVAAQPLKRELKME
jgi:hypothetical protein